MYILKTVYVCDCTIHVHERCKLNQKQNEALSNMTVEELQAQLDALNADDTESEDE